MMIKSINTIYLFFNCFVQNKVLEVQNNEISFLEKSLSLFKESSVMESFNEITLKTKFRSGTNLWNFLKLYFVLKQLFCYVFGLDIIDNQQLILYSLIH